MRRNLITGGRFEPKHYINHGSGGESMTQRNAVRRTYSKVLGHSTSAHGPRVTKRP